MSNFMRRAKTADHRSWIYGASLLSCDKDAFMVAEGSHFVSNYENGRITTLHFTSGCFTAIDVDTLGCAMDVEARDGQMIFEGDIVKGFNTFHDREERYVVRRNTHGLWFCENANEWHVDHIDDLEVIGNIWDTPELAEGVVV